MFFLATKIRKPITSGVYKIIGDEIRLRTNILQYLRGPLGKHFMAKMHGKLSIPPWQVGPVGFLEGSLPVTQGFVPKG